MDIGKSLKQVFEKEKITAREVSVKFQIDEGYLSKILNNKINPSCRWLVEILGKLGYTIEFKKKGGKKNQEG